MVDAYKRHDISDVAWKRLEPHLPGARARREAMRGTIGSLSMQFSGFYERAHLGAIFRLPVATARIHIEDFAAGATKESGKSLLEQLIAEPKFELLMIDASHVKIYATWNRSSWRQ